MFVNMSLWDWINGPPYLDSLEPSETSEGMHFSQ